MKTDGRLMKVTQRIGKDFRVNLLLIFVFYRRRTRTPQFRSKVFHMKPLAKNAVELFFAHIATVRIPREIREAINALEDPKSLIALAIEALNEANLSLSAGETYKALLKSAESSLLTIHAMSLAGAFEPNAKKVATVPGVGRFISELGIQMVDDALPTHFMAGIMVRGIEFHFSYPSGSDHLSYGAFIFCANRISAALKDIGNASLLHTHRRFSQPQDGIKALGFSFVETTIKVAIIDYNALNDTNFRLDVVDDMKLLGV